VKTPLRRDRLLAVDLELISQGEVTCRTRERPGEIGAATSLRGLG